MHVNASTLGSASVHSNASINSECKFTKFGEIWRNLAKFGEIWQNLAKFGEYTFAKFGEIL